MPFFWATNIPKCFRNKINDTVLRIVGYCVKIQKPYIQDPRVNSALSEAWSYVRNSANQTVEPGCFVISFPHSSLWKYAL